MIDQQGLLTLNKFLDKIPTNKKLAELQQKIFENKLNLFIRHEIVEKFWNFFDVEQTNENVEYSIKLHECFINAIEFLESICQSIDKLLHKESHNILKDRVFAALKTQILYDKPYHFKKYLSETYHRAFRAFLYLQRKELKDENSMQEDKAKNDDDNEEEDDDDDDEEEEEFDEASINQDKRNCTGCNEDISSSGDEDYCKCQEFYDRFCKVNEFLRNVKLLDHLVGETILSVVRYFIDKKVSAKCKSNFSSSYLTELTDWVHHYIKKWILQIYKDENPINDSTLDCILKDAYAEVRILYMFDIIVLYPDSEAAIEDLKVCLEQTTSSDFRLNLIENVKKSLTEGLLHTAVNTHDILSAYISAIKALRALDPTGLILQLVTEPVRKYLKSRDDTVRCIVTALTDEDHSSELNKEMKSSSQTNENGQVVVETNLPSEGEKCTAKNFEKWKPDPIKLSTADNLMKSNRFSDIVSILVNIYETKDLFVEEYQKLLSQRLLNKYDKCNLDTELRNLELLTIRFSDCELHRCEVMLKDVQTSKRINKRILSGDIWDHKLKEFKNLDVLIVSSPFWPENFGPMASTSEESPDVQFPPEIQEAISIYTKAFESIQASRTLHWRHHLGSVNLDLTINGESQNFTVSPLHASLLYLFKERKSWHLSELMHRTSLPGATLRSRLTFWVYKKIIDTNEDRYDLII